MDLRELPRAVRAELRGLSAQMGEIVGAHLLMAGQLIESDPALAYRHAEAARRRAARLPIVREAAGEAAYAAGEYLAALNEFRALRRMNGSDDYLAAMADCERALGNPDKGLRLVKEGLKNGASFTQRVELRLVEAGCRYDLDQADEALRLLKGELESSGGRGTRAARVRLRYGYANLLELTGDADNAERWFTAAAALDVEGETDAAERVQALQGLVLTVDEDDLVGDEPIVDASADEADDSDLDADASDADEAEDADEDDSEDADEDDDSDEDESDDDSDDSDDSEDDEPDDDDSDDGAEEGGNDEETDER